MQARPEDLKGARAAATLSKIIDEPREKIQKASPKIKAKREAESRNSRPGPTDGG